MTNSLSPGARVLVLTTAIAALLFDGVELGLMPVASLSVSHDLLADQFTPKLAGDWFARFTASLMFGAAVGGILLGNLGDVIGRSRALGVSVLFYSAFAGLGALVSSQEQMLLLRFLVGLGVGGVWPNAVALASECWPNRSRPVVAGLLGAALNGGIFLLSLLAQFWPITAGSWRWIFLLAAAPVCLGLLILVVVPESPQWLAIQCHPRNDSPSVRITELFRPPLLHLTLIGILLGTIPLLGAWGASKWMIPWADQTASAIDPTYKARTQNWWALGAVLGSFFGAQIAAPLGRRLSYCLISLGATTLTLFLFLGTEPLRPGFHLVVFFQGLIATLFFGWFPLYLPELFPARVRATGTGITYNVGRFATAFGVLAAGWLFTSLGGSYPQVGAICGCVYALGAFAIWLAPDTNNPTTDEV